MKPAPFEYYAPRTVDEALSHLAEHGYDAKVLAGGQSLIPMMNFRLSIMKNGESRGNQFLMSMSATMNTFCASCANLLNVL